MTAQDQQSRAEFDLWYADHIGDENKPVRDAAWETWQHLRNVEGSVIPGDRKAKWFLHTLDNTEGIPGNLPEEIVTESKNHPFGKPGIDYDAEFPVTTRPLYEAPRVQAMGRVPVDVEEAWDAFEEAVRVNVGVKELVNIMGSVKSLRTMFLKAVTRPPAAQEGA